MSTYLDGLNTVNSLTSRINALKQPQQAVGDEAQNALYELQKNFNDMLNSLISSSDDEEKKKSAYDPFAQLL